MKSTKVTLFRKIGIAWVGLLVTALILSACGGPTVPPQPTSTPLPAYKVDIDRQLYFTISVPSEWSKNTVDANTVTYFSPAVQNTNITISTQGVDKLLPENKSLLDRRIKTVTDKYIQIKRADAGQVTFTDSSVPLTELRYNNGADVVEYLAQVNVVNASRAYLLQGLSPVATADEYRQKFLTSFGSMTFNPPDGGGLPIPTGGSGAINPTIIAARDGGQILPRQNSPEDNSIRRLPLTDWVTPPLNNNLLALSGKFPSRWLWRLRPFPRPEDPGIVFSANNPGGSLSSSSAEASVFIGIVQNAFTSDNAPSKDEFEKAVTPVVEYYNANTLATLGQVVIEPPGPITTNQLAGVIVPPNTPVPAGTPGTPAPTAVRVTPTATLVATAPVQNLWRAGFTVRDSNGRIFIRGAIYLKPLGRNLVVSSLQVSPGVALNDSVVNEYNEGMIRIMNSLKQERSLPVIN